MSLVRIEDHDSKKFAISTRWSRNKGYHGKCSVCGEEAYKDLIINSGRKDNWNRDILRREARCRQCFNENSGRYTYELMYGEQPWNESKGGVIRLRREFGFRSKREERERDSGYKQQYHYFQYILVFREDRDPFLRRQHYETAKDIEERRWLFKKNLRELKKEIMENRREHKEIVEKLEKEKNITGPMEIREKETITHKEDWLENEQQQAA